MTDTPDAPIRDIDAMIASMAPVLDPETYIFCTVPQGDAAPEVIDAALASFRENEGLSLILTHDKAKELGCDTDLPMRRITLTVNSALDGIGLTAAVAGVLAANAIACNMVAATQHDHAFVPEADAGRALHLLTELSGS